MIENYTLKQYHASIQFSNGIMYVAFLINKYTLCIC